MAHTDMWLQVSLRGLFLLSNNIARGRRATSHPREGSRYEGGVWNPPANLLTQKVWSFCSSSRSVYLGLSSNPMTHTDIWLQVSLRGLLLSPTLPGDGRHLFIIRARGVETRGGWIPPANLLTQKVWLFCSFSTTDPPWSYQTQWRIQICGFR